MQKSNVVSKKTIENAIYFLVMFAAAAITPFIAKPLAKLFDGITMDWSERGQLREFFVQLITCLFWGLEWLALYYVNKKRKAAKTSNDVESEISEQAEVLAEAAVADAAIKKKRFLPMTNLVFLLGITVVCVFVLSAQIDFQVKPFYDIGEKISLSGLVVKGSILVGNIIKCIWTVLLLRYALRFATALTENTKLAQYSWVKWCITGALVFLYGVYDVLITANPFAWTYLLFYVAFTLVYYLMEKNEKKSFLLIFFIYIF